MSELYARFDIGLMYNQWVTPISYINTSAYSIQAINGQTYLVKISTQLYGSVIRGYTGGFSDSDAWGWPCVGPY